MSYNDDERIDPSQDVTGYKRTSELLGEISGKYRLGVDLVTVLDVSGSMKDGDKLQKMKIALQILIKKLSSIDRLSVVTFADGSERLCPLRRITENSQQEIEQLINNLVTNGNANISSGLETGLKVLNERRFTNKRSVGIVLLSDGHQDKQFPEIDFNDVPLYTFGFGPEHDEVLMAIAHNIDRGTFSDVQNKFSQYLVGLLNVVVQVLKVIFTQVKSRIENVSAGLNKEPKTKEVTTRAKQNPCPTHSKLTLGLILFIFCLVVSFISYKPDFWYSSSQLIQPTQYSPLMKTEELRHETSQPIEEATQKDEKHQLDDNWGNSDVLMNAYIEEAMSFSEDDDPIYDDESTIGYHIEASKEPEREEVKTRAKQNPHPTHSMFTLGWILFSFCLFVRFIFYKPIRSYFSSQPIRPTQCSPPEMSNPSIQQRSVIQRFASRVRAFFTGLMNIYHPQPAPLPESKPVPKPAPMPEPEPQPVLVPEPEPQPLVVVVKNPKLDENVKQQLTAYIEKAIQSFKFMESILNLMPAPQPQPALEPQPQLEPKPEPELAPQPEPELESKSELEPAIVPAPVPELEPEPVPEPQPAPEPPVVVVKKPKFDEDVKQQLTAYIEKAIQSFKSMESILNLMPAPQPQPALEPQPQPQLELEPKSEPELAPQPEPELESKSELEPATVPAPVLELEPKPVPEPQPAPEPPVVVVKKPKFDENVKQQFTAYIEKAIQSFKSIESTLNLTSGPGTDDHGQVMSLDENVKQTLAAYIQKAIQSIKTIENTLIKSGWMDTLIYNVVQ